jgi:hypothetical protein
VIDDEDDADKPSAYHTRESWKKVLLPLIKDSPWLLRNGKTWFSGLVWTIFGQKYLKKLYYSWGCKLISGDNDWYQYTREHFLIRYHEEVQDKRGWHDMMETSLYLVRYMKELKMAELGEKDSDNTDDAGGFDEGGGDDEDPDDGGAPSKGKAGDKGKGKKTSAAGKAKKTSAKEKSTKKANRKEQDKARATTAKERVPTSEEDTENEFLESIGRRKRR